jgi:serine/threonine-protein kinase
MGEVYEAPDTRLGRTVAIKVLPQELASDEVYRRRLEHEAKTIARLQHPNICALYDVGSEPEAPFFLVMEHLAGETLGDRTRRGPLPLEDCLRIGREIANAMDAAHRRQVVHRDLKPANVMLTEHGTKVLDFGLAKEVATGHLGLGADTLTWEAPISAEGTISGTVPYRRPSSSRDDRPTRAPICGRSAVSSTRWSRAPVRSAASPRRH